MNRGDWLNVLGAFWAIAAPSRAFAEWLAVARELVLVMTEIARYAMSPSKAATSATMASNRAG